MRISHTDVDIFVKHDIREHLTRFICVDTLSDAVKIPNRKYIEILELSYCSNNFTVIILFPIQICKGSEMK